MSVRIYVPATLTSLAAHVRSGRIPGEVERFVPEADDEEAEYAALMAAADAARELPDGDRRRVVVVAVVDTPAAVDATIPLDTVVAVHADTEDGADPDAELGWFATQEIPDLLG